MRRTALILVCLVAAPEAGSTQSALPAQAPVSLQSVTVGEGPSIVIAAAGPLRVPRVGVLQAPDRIYVDLPGVSARASSTPGNGGAVSGVRVAQHSLEPLVTRIVIDLARPSRYSLDTSQLERGRLSVSLTAVAAPAPPRGALPAASEKNPVSSGTASPRRTLDPAARRYLAVVQPGLERLVTLREVLSDIDRRTNPSADRIQAARTELASLRRALEAAKPPPRMSDAHDLLNSVVGFASTALNLTTDESGGVTANASSAAAGALLMLERAQAELGIQR